jgi:cytochrome c peroxidase
LSNVKRFIRFPAPKKIGFRWQPETKSGCKSSDARRRRHDSQNEAAQQAGEFLFSGRISMKKPKHIAEAYPAFTYFARISTVGAILVCLASSVSSLAVAQQAGSGAGGNLPAFAPGMIDHMQAMRRFKDPDQSVQQAPPIIPKFEMDSDPAGAIATFQPAGATFPANNPFFQNLGTNGRTCFTCHQPQNGWTVSSSSVTERFTNSNGTDPIFRLVDGATCPTADVSTLPAKRRAYALLIEKGLIRIGLPMPSGTQFAVTSVDDPYSCNTNPVTGLTSATTGIVSIYRRPLPSTNLNFLSTVMFDGREPDLTSQARDATLGHAQANATPTDAQLAEIVAFETGIYTAQEIDRIAKVLHRDGALGGPVALSLQPFFIGVNDPFGKNPTGLPFTSNIFDIYRPWLSAAGHDEDDVEQRRSIARGEEVFNTTNINITGVAGINDVLGVTSFSGFCGTCHDTPNVGDHSVKAPLDIGIADAGAKSPPALDISGLPVFTLTCTQGPLAGQVFKVTDPGRALISGQCADIGKVKGPILRGLASRAPYFHNGSAATLRDAVNFYDQRFGIGFTDQQKTDLVNFLNTL